MGTAVESEPPMDASHAERPARRPLHTRLIGQRTPNLTRPSASADEPASAQAQTSNRPRAAQQSHQIKEPNDSSHGKRPASPFATHGEHVQVLALVDAALDVRHQHLLGMRDELLATGYIGPRHAIREARVQKRSPLRPAWLGGTQGVHVRPAK